MFYAMELNNSTHKGEIIILLLADMRNTRLILGLRSVGLNTDNFYTNLTDLILQKMGFENYEDKLLRSWYEDTMNMVIDIEPYDYIFHERALAERMHSLLNEKRDSLKQDSQASLQVEWSDLFKRWWRGN